MSVSVQYLGLSCFRLGSKINDQEVTLVTDPYSSSCGLKLPRSLESNIVVVSSADENHSFIDGVSGDPFLISGPGEYEVKKIFAYGVQTASGQNKKQASTTYRIEMGDLSIGHLGNLDRALSETEAEHLDGVDILFVPVGGSGVLSAKGAMDLINEIQPRIVIPCHFKMPDLKLSLDPVDKFLREFGASKLEPQTKVKISKKDLPQEETEVILMARG